MNLKGTLGSPAYRESTLRWLAGLRDPGQVGYRLWSGGPAHLLPTCFALFLRELFCDLPDPEGEEAAELADWLLAFRNSENGTFDGNLPAERLGPRHDEDYLRLQQSHFALQALRLIGRWKSCSLPFIERWSTWEKLTGYFEALDWRDPWRESNKVMFVLYFYEHEFSRTGERRMMELYHAGLDWLRGNQDPRSGLWGISPGKRIYNAVYGAYHFIFFFMHLGLPVPGAAQILKHTRRLRTSEGFFAHARGGGACEDYDCVDLLIKLGGEDDRERLLATAASVLSARNPDGGYAWARSNTGGLEFLLRNWMPELSLKENAGLLLQRLKDLAGGRDFWTYSGLESLHCSRSASDIWSTWFRNLILAEIDDRFLHSGARWGFRRFPSLGWFDSGSSNDRPTA